VKTVFLALACFALALTATAADAPAPAAPPAPAAAPPAGSATVPNGTLPGTAPATRPETYFLRGLKPVGLSQQAAGNGIRQLLQFKNEQGSQNIVYEEIPAQPPVKEISLLAPFLASGVHTCSIDLECKARAFCANECRSLYYEVTNSPAEPSMVDKSNCLIRAFSCVIGNAPAAAATPPPAPGAAPPAPPAKTP
jgi:hypothetical protein